MTLEQDSLAFLERLEETTEEVEEIIAQLEFIDNGFAGCTFYVDVNATQKIRVSICLGFENETSFNSFDLPRLGPSISQSQLKLHLEILASEYGLGWENLEIVIEKYLLD